MKKFEELDDNMLENVAGGVSAEDDPRATEIKKFMSDYKSKCRAYTLAGDSVPFGVLMHSEGKGTQWYNKVIIYASSGRLDEAVNIIDVFFAPGLRELSATYPEFAEFLTRLDNLHNG